MKARLLLVAPLLLLGLAACGDDEGDDNPSAEESADNGSDSTDSSDAPDATEETDDGDDSGGRYGNGGGGDFCENARALDESDVTDGFLSSDPAAVEAAFDEYLELLGNVVDSAPDEVKDELAALHEGFERVKDGVEAAGWNFIEFSGSPEGVQAFEEIGQGNFDASSAYLQSECGIDIDG